MADAVAPTVSLSDSDDEDNIISLSDVVTITATFSEAMSLSPTINLSGIISDIPMSPTDTAARWTYLWAVSGTTVTATTATVFGKDLAGNPINNSGDFEEPYARISVQPRYATWISGESLDLNRVDNYLLPGNTHRFNFTICFKLI